jgi:hypothetical protein
MFQSIMTTSTFFSSSLIMFFMGNFMNVSSRRRIMVTSSSIETSADPLGNRVGVRGERRYSAVPPFYSRLLDRYLKTM